MDTGRTEQEPPTYRAWGGVSEGDGTSLARGSERKHVWGSGRPESSAPRAVVRTEGNSRSPQDEGPGLLTLIQLPLQEP